MSENLVPIFIKIDCTKIIKERLFLGKKGAKYLDAILVPTRDSQFGEDYFIAQSVSKEEREAGVKGPILGNAKLSRSQQGGGSYKPANAAPKAAPSRDEEDSSIPF